VRQSLSYAVLRSNCEHKKPGKWEAMGFTAQYALLKKDENKI
jgi:hypothetical protein